MATREVQEYIDKIPENKLEPFHYIRNRMLQIEGVEENFEYSMPTYILGNRKIFALAAQKNYVSFYVMHIETLDQVRDELAHLNVGKSCVRFTKVKKFPEPIFEKIIEETLKLL